MIINPPNFKVKHDLFKNSFFPSTLIEWNKLDLNIRNPERLTNFKGNIFKFIHPSENSVFLCNNPKRIQLLTRLRFGLIHLREHNLSITSETSLIQFVSALRILKLRVTILFTLYQ